MKSLTSMAIRLREKGISKGIFFVNLIELFRFERSDCLIFHEHRVKSWDVICGSVVRQRDSSVCAFLIGLSSNLIALGPPSGAFLACRTLLQLLHVFDSCRKKRCPATECVLFMSPFFSVTLVIIIYTRTVA